MRLQYLMIGLSAPLKLCILSEDIIASNSLLTLQLLAISDFVVVIGGALLYGLPDLWHAYSLRTYPFILPYVLPTVQIAMMISIYTTILMSFERYVRIGHTCRLKDCSYMTDDNFKYYLCTIVIAPCIFYVPKFFELYAEETRVGVDIEVNCHSVLNPPKVNLTVMKGMSQCLKIT